MSRRIPLSGRSERSEPHKKRSVCAAALPGPAKEAEEDSRHARMSRRIPLSGRSERSEPHKKRSVCAALPGPAKEAEEDSRHARMSG